MKALGIKVKNIVWDLDGTLFDTWDLHIQTVKEIYCLYYREKISTLKILRKQDNNLLKTLNNIFVEEKLEEILSQYRLITKKIINDGYLFDKLNIKAVFEENFGKEKGAQLEIITGRDYFTTDLILEKYEIKHFFNKIICSENLQSEKSKYLEESKNKYNDWIYVTDSMIEKKQLEKYFKDIILVNWFKENDESYVAEKMEEIIYG